MQDSNAIVTLIIIVGSGILTFQGLNNPTFFQKLMFDNRAISGGKEYYRMFTSGFLHADWMHFAFNMFSLFSFGSVIERNFTSTNLLLIYFASILGGNILSLVIYKKIHYRAIGASGGVCGVIYASIFLIPGGSIYIMPIPIAIPSWIYAILFLLISFYGMKSGRDNIGHIAHLGGALVGLAVTFLLFPRAVTAQPELVGLILLISAGIVGYETWKKKRNA